MDVFVDGDSCQALFPPLSADAEKAAKAIADWIVEKDHTLIFSAVRGGLMQTLYQEIQSRPNHTEIIGITDHVRRLNCDRVEFFPTFRERLAFSWEESDIFIFLPGHTSTCLALLFMAEKRLKYHGKGKRIVIFNPRGFFDPAIKELVPDAAQVFLEEASTVEELMMLLSQEQ